MNKKYYYLLFLPLSLLIGCSQGREESQSEVNHSNMAKMDKGVASEFLIQTLESYREDPFEELVNDVGVGDNYYVVSEGNDGSEEGYSVSIEIEWQSEERNSLILTATMFGPGPEGGGLVPELQKESIIIKRP